MLMFKVAQMDSLCAALLQKQYKGGLGTFPLAFAQTSTMGRRSAFTNDQETHIAAFFPVYAEQYKSLGARTSALSQWLDATVNGIYQSHMFVEQRRLASQAEENNADAESTEASFKGVGFPFSFIYSTSMLTPGVENQTQIPQLH